VETRRSVGLHVKRNVLKVAFLSIASQKSTENEHCVRRQNTEKYRRCHRNRLYYNFLKIDISCRFKQENQQGWHTSAVAIGLHLVVAHLVSICLHHVCLLPTKIFLHITYFHRHQWTACVRAVSVSWILFSCLQIPLHGTPANSHVRLILLEKRIPGLHFCRWWYGSILIQLLVVGSKRRV